MTRNPFTLSSPCSVASASRSCEITALSLFTDSDARSVSSKRTILLSSSDLVRVTSPRSTRPSTLAVTDGLLTPVRDASLDTVQPSSLSIITRYR